MACRTRWRGGVRRRAEDERFRAELGQIGRVIATEGMKT